MREMPDASGVMPYRLFFDDGEIDLIMEDELQKAGTPTLAGRSAIDIEAFIESHLGVTPQYEKLPNGVEGATDFYRDGDVRMAVSADLSTRADSNAGAETLLRSTLAHEASHVLLHKVLYLKQTEALFASDASKRQLCRDIAPAGAYSGQWWEWQANQGMGALLLPRSQVIRFAQRAREDGRTDELIVTGLVECFAVSHQMATLRLQGMNATSHRNQSAWKF